MSLKVNRYTQGVWLILGLLLISGCGFHLRGAPSYTLPFARIHLSPIDDFNPLYKQLRFSLEQKNIKICPDKEAKSPDLTLINYDFSYRPMAYNRESKVQTEKVMLQATYQIHDKYGLKKNTINIRRFRQVNFNHKLADLREKEIMEKAMIRDLSDQILLQLTARCK